jgi:ABC-type glutathione transport system ATPase component
MGLSFAGRSSADHGASSEPWPRGEPLLEARGLTKVYGRQRKGERAADQAVKDADLALLSGECLGIVGESGSGKTTLADCLAGLSVPTSGEVRYRGSSVNAAGMRPRVPRVRGIQMVYQDPFSSLNPRRDVGSIISEILRVHRLRSRRDVQDRVHELFGLVGLGPELSGRRPRRLSGGQQQRVAIARALAFEPDVVIADEVVSSLDASLQAQILNLLSELQSRLRLSIVMITHDMAVVRQSCDRVAVMRSGEIVELGTTSDVLERPRHDYTRALLEAVPRLEGSLSGGPP